MGRRKSALNQRRGKMKSSSKVASRKVGSVKARNAASIRRRQKKRSMLDRYEDDDFIVEDEVTADWQPRKKARIRKQMEVDPPTPVFEAEIWPTIDSDTTDFEFVTSDEEAAIAEPTRVIKKGRKKRVFVSDSSSDSEFVVSDKELGNLKESEPPESLKVLPSSPRKISVTGNGEHKGKEKKEPQEAGRATCGICLSEEQRVTVQGVLDCCSHYFCFACIMQWSKVESRCPLCKRRFTTITKSSKEDTGLELTNSVIRVEERDQVTFPCCGCHIISNPTAKFVNFISDLYGQSIQNNIHEYVYCHSAVDVSFILINTLILSLFLCDFSLLLCLFISMLELVALGDKCYLEN